MLATVLIRAFIIYALLICFLRLSGKRQIGELQVSELVITFMVSDLAAAPIQDITIPLSYSVAPIVFLLSLEIVISFLVTKSKALRGVFEGSPSFVIKRGIVNQKELEKARISISELISELRLKDVSSINDVDYAIIEQNGKLSVFLKDEKQNATVKDVGGQTKRGGIAHAIIVDRAINYNNLSISGKSEKWLLKYLDTHKLSTKSIFLMTIDDASKISITLKDEG